MLLEDGWIFEPALFSQIEKFIIGDAAPDEKRQTRGQFEIADSISSVGRGICRIAFDTEQEFRINQYSLKRRPDTRLEPTRAAAHCIQLEERPNIFVGYGAAKGAARTGRTFAQEPAPTHDHAGIAAAHRKALEKLAADIAATIRGKF